MSLQSPTASGVSGASFSGASAESPAESPADLLGDRHALPGWFRWAQDVLFLSLLIIAEMYLLATGGAEGWVPQLDNLTTWGWFHGAGVIVFFLACASAAGIALGLSLVCSLAFARREWGRALFTFVGAFCFALIEVIINLSERSWNLRPSPFDQWVLAVLHVPTNIPFTPTLLATSLLLPATTFFYGWARAPKTTKQVRSVAEIRAEADAAEAEAEAKRRKKLADEDAAHKARLIREGRLTLADLQRQEAAERAALRHLVDPVSSFDGDDPADDDDDETNGEDGGNVTPIMPVGIPTNYWQAKDVVAYVARHYGRTITLDDARARVRAAKGAVQYTRVTGQPWAAPRAALKRVLDRAFASTAAAVSNE